MPLLPVTPWVRKQPHRAATQYDPRKRPKCCPKGPIHTQTDRLTDRETHTSGERRTDGTGGYQRGKLGRMGFQADAPIEADKRRGRRRAKKTKIKQWKTGSTHTHRHRWKKRNGSMGREKGRGSDKRQSIAKPHRQTEYTRSGRSYNPLSFHSTVLF